MLVMFAKRARIGPKGQVVIPKHLRDEFHLAPGDEVVVATDGERVVITPAPEDPIAFFEAMAKKEGGRRPRLGPHESERELAERHRRRLP